MGIHLPIRARIVDIRHDAPRADDHLLLDTNVCLWLSWTRVSEGNGAAKPYQLQQYPRYVNLALENRSALYHSAISYAEISHHIERSEYQLAAHRHRALTRKEFRQTRRREQVVRDIKSVWYTIQQISSIIPTPMEDTATKTVQALLQELPLGPFDLFLVNAMQLAGLTGIVTDDMDFGFVPGITVFTSNLAVIKRARETGHLYTRHYLASSGPASDAALDEQHMPR